MTTGHVTEKTAGGPGHEKRDVDARRIIWVCVMVFGFTALSLVVGRGIFDLYVWSTAPVETPQAPTPKRRLEAPPWRAEVEHASGEQLRNVRAAERETLSRYTWA